MQVRFKTFTRRRRSSVMTTTRYVAWSLVAVLGGSFLLAAAGCGDDDGSGSSGEAESSSTSSTSSTAPSPGSSGTGVGGSTGAGDAASSGVGGSSAVSSSSSSVGGGGAGGGAAADPCLLPASFPSPYPAFHTLVDGVLVGTPDCFEDEGAFAEIHKHDCATGETSVVQTDLPCENTTVSSFSSRDTLFFRLVYEPLDEPRRRELVELDLDGVELHRRVLLDDSAGIRSVGAESPDGMDRLWLRDGDPEAEPFVETLVVLDREGGTVPIAAEAAEVALGAGRTSWSGVVSFVETNELGPNLLETTYVLATPEGTHSFSGSSAIDSHFAELRAAVGEDLHFGVHATSAQGGCSLEFVLRDMMTDEEVFRSEPLLTDNDYLCQAYDQRPGSAEQRVVVAALENADDDHVVVRIRWGIQTSVTLPGVYEGDARNHLLVAFSRATGALHGVLDPAALPHGMIFAGSRFFLLFPEGDGESVRLVEYDAETLLPR
jgi:hypothetical protein